MQILHASSIKSGSFPMSMLFKQDNKTITKLVMNFLFVEAGSLRIKTTMVICLSRYCRFWPQLYRVEHLKLFQLS